MSDRLKLSDPAGDAELKNIVVALEQQELDQRIRQLEKNIAELKQAAADGKKGAAAPATPQNNKIGARKDSKFKAISTTPSVNKTPVGPSMVPIPYPTVQDLSNSINTARSVKFNGKPAYLLDQSTQPKGKGDEPGTGKGVKSGTVTGEVKPVQGCKTVRIEGKYVVREGDACTMNGGNNEGIFVTTIAASGAPPRTAIETSNPPVPVSPGKNWSAANPLGLPEPSSVADKVAAMLRQDALDGNAPVQRINALLQRKPTGPMFQPVEADSDVDPYLHTRNRITTQLLGPFGAPGAVAQLYGASEERIADVNQVGAAAMGVVWSLTGLPNRQGINLKPEANQAIALRISSASNGVKIVSQQAASGAFVGVPINGATRNVPLGFEQQAQFITAAKQLQEALQSSGITDALVGVRGSSVTGSSIRKGTQFGKKSDIDFFIESEQLTNNYSTSRNIPGFVHPGKILPDYPKLDEWSQNWTKILGRDVTPGVFKPGMIPDEPAIIIKPKNP